MAVNVLSCVCLLIYLEYVRIHPNSGGASVGGKTINFCNGFVGRFTQSWYVVATFLSTSPSKVLKLDKIISSNC